MRAPLSAGEWSAPTVAWTVKDVAAHILDTALRRLSIQRDGHMLSDPSIRTRRTGSGSSRSATPPLHESYLRAVMATFVRALPFTYRDVDAPRGTTVVFNEWTLVSEDAWRLYEARAADAVTTVEIADDAA